MEVAEERKIRENINKEIRKKEKRKKEMSF